MSNELIREDTFSSDEDFEEDGDDSESSTDVDAKLAQEEVFDDEFLKCYSALKKKDSTIYDKNVKFFNDEKSSSSEDEAESNHKSASRRRAPKMTLLDHQLNLKDEELEEMPTSLLNPKIDLSQPVSKSFYEKELDEIKKSIDKVNEDIGSDSDDEILVVKGSEPGPSKKEKPRKLLTALLDKMEDDEDEHIKHLKEIWSDPKKLTKEEKYLRDYILNKRYIAPIEDEAGKSDHFSKNLEELSDVEDESDKDTSNKDKSETRLRSEDKGFDKIARIPRNSTKTIRDMKEKQEKKEKRLKKVEKEKKKKKSLKNVDCEDIVGDLPTRFHYRETEANDYGLSAEELLMATDEELEKWVSLKDAISYKSIEEELAQKRKYESKRNDLELKKQIFKSIYGDPKEAAIESSPKSKKKGKRKRTDSETVDAELEPNQSELVAEPEISNNQRKKKKHRRGLNHKKFSKSGVAPDRLLAYGLSKTKLKKSKLL